MSQSYFSLKATADAQYTLWSHPDNPRIDFAYDTSSIAAGIDDLVDEFKAVIKNDNLHIDTGMIAGYGLQWANPLIQITSSDGTTVLYGNVTKADIPILIKEAQGLNRNPLDITLGMLHGERNDIVSIDKHPYLQLEKERRLLRNVGYINPDNIEHYIARDGYLALSNILERGLTDEEIRKEITDSGLAGRGGAFFPTGVKWGFLSSANNDNKYLICNADEGDPGSWVNRILMESDPHTIIEGMIIAASATYSNSGYIYIRSEYPLAIERMQKAIDDAYEKGILGNSVLESKLSFDLRIIKGAGAYVCGEETGLIASIQDARGMPRIKPPFPANSGVFFEPTNVNNVESFASIPMIIRNGSDWYKEYGVDSISGTKLFSISGDIENAGIMELPWGTKISSVLKTVGGITNNSSFKALQAGGPLAGYLPSSIAQNLALVPEQFKEHNALIGSGGLVFVSDNTCSIQLNLLFSQFVEDESCGRCTTCHGGNQRMTEVFKRIAKGGGRKEDMRNLDIIANTLLYSNCVHGQASPTIMKNTVDLFADEYNNCTINKVCSGSTCACPGLIKLIIVDQFNSKLNDALKICPVGAIKKINGKYNIDMKDCIRCGACIEQAPDAIKQISDGNVYETPSFIPRLFSENFKNLIPEASLITLESITTNTKIRGEKSLSGMQNL
jgi:NADH:ubiquinone oxidoreductase subunit F (NADH-binding)/NAD-dependent dihydropyrimidine dehydrogenase PreA subunit